VTVTFGQNGFLFDRPFGNDMRQQPLNTDATTVTPTAAATAAAMLASNLLCKAL